MAAKPADIEAWLEQLGQPSADRDYRPGHERMLALLAELPEFRPRLRIRVAGTNGKGSTSHMLAHALQAAGLKVGLYTSPHILAFNERIRIDGTPVSDACILAHLEKLMPSALAVGASYFETATATALAIFADLQVEAEILEAGVGARLDATTAVPADMALITPIALDHQAWLGDTVATIAGEKAHAMDGCRWSLSALQSPAVEKVLLRANSALRFIEPGSWRQLAMPGAHQRTNASLALAAAETLLAAGVIRMDDVEALRKAIADTRVAGRLQHIRHQQADIWLDAAHNQHGVEAVIPALRELADPFDAILLFTREDRDLSAAIDLLRPYARRLFGNKGTGCDRLFDRAEDGLRSALAEKPDGKFLILGSFTTLAAVLRQLGTSSSAGA